MITPLWRASSVLSCALAWLLAIACIDNMDVGEGAPDGSAGMRSEASGGTSPTRGGSGGSDGRASGGTTTGGMSGGTSGAAAAAQDRW